MESFVQNSIEFQLNQFEIPKKYVNISWDQLTDIDESDKQLAKDYVSDFKRSGKHSLYIYEKTSGTGKTSYAICLAKDLILSGKLSTYALYLSYSKLMDSLRQDRGPFVVSDLFRRIAGADFLLLDDIGVIRLNRSVAERYYLILELLWSEEIPVVFTSKFTINELLVRAEEDVDHGLLESIGSRFEGICEEIQLKNTRDFRSNEC